MKLETWRDVSQSIDGHAKDAAWSGQALVKLFPEDAADLQRDIKPPQGGRACCFKWAEKYLGDAALDHLMSPFKEARRGGGGGG